jgi:hypothetical protein
MSRIFTTDIDPVLYISGTHTLDEWDAEDYLGAKYMIVGQSGAGIVEISEFLVVHDYTAAQVSNIITVGNRSPFIASFSAAYLRGFLRLTMVNTLPLKVRVYRTLIEAE